MNPVSDIYSLLLSEYGNQGWWPLMSLKRRYHPGDYSYPRTSNQKFEIAAGAVITQNTSWVQAEKALLQLKQKKILDAKTISVIDAGILADLLKASGYFNQKAKKLKALSEYWLSLKEAPEREMLLDIWGIGPETADSILLYAFSVPYFVVDAYTRRIFSRLGLIKDNLSYEQVRHYFEKNLDQDIKIYQEYHALIVEHAKRSCRKTPECSFCVLKKNCSSRSC